MSDVGDLGRRVTERRHELGLSTEQVARQAGMDPTYLGSLERDPAPQLSREGLWRLAAALSTTVDDLAGGGTQEPPGRSDPTAPAVLTSLDPDECRRLIAAGGVGRVIFTEPRGPVALPVNFRTLGSDIVVRTEPDAALVSSAAIARISFEVDHLDDALAEGWSVLVSGNGYQVTAAAELNLVKGLGDTPWAGGERTTFVRIVPDVVTGRRIRRHQEEPESVTTDRAGARAQTGPLALLGAESRAQAERTTEEGVSS
jgi:transcriptional regulator with XRE-family HTH domain